MSIQFPLCRTTIGALVVTTASLCSGADLLTLDDAQRIASGRSAQMDAQSARANAAREQSVAAGQVPDPVLRFGINNLPVNGVDRFSLTRDFMTMRSVSIAQEITRGEKRKARSARLDREAEVAEAGRVLALANLRRDTAVAWLQRHFLERIRDLLLAQRVEASLQVEAADGAYRSGRGAQTEVFAARSAVAQIDDRMRQNQTQIATAATRLARWVGESASRPLADPPGLDMVRVQTNALEAQMAHHPRIALLAQQEQVARAEVDLAQSNKRPDWNVELMYSQRGPAYSNMVSVNVSVPLQFDQKNRQDREVAARMAGVQQARAELEEATRELLAEGRGWLQEWQGNRGRMAHYDSALVPLAAERTRAALVAYRGGSGPLAAVLEARRMEIDIRIERLRLEMETAGLWAQLSYLVAPGNAADDTQDRAAKTLEKLP